MRRWPDWMPIPQQNGYAFQAEDRRTKDDLGVFSPFLDEFGLEESIIECSLVLDQVQCAWFESFEGELLSQGAEWFEMPLLSGREVKWHKVRMQERPSFGSLKGCIYTMATMKLELDDGPDEEADLIEIPAWPDSFPLPLQKDYAYAPHDRRAWAQMEVGNLARVEYATDETKISCTVLLNRTEWEQFRRFVRRDLKRGTRWFTMPLQSSGGIDIHTVRLRTLPKAGSFIARHLHVSFELDVWRRENSMCGWVTELLGCRPPEIWVDFHKDFSDILGGISVTLPDFWIPQACRERKVRYEFGY